MLKIFPLILSLALLAPSPAFAASIKGKLKLAVKNASPSQYKVLAVFKKGSAKLANVSAKGNFSVSVAKGASLHLVDSSNRYLGPIVAVDGKKAFTTCSGKGGSVGVVSVKSAFATVPRGKASNLFSTKAVAFRKQTGPAGAGKLGLTKRMSKAFTAAADSKSDIGDDPDGDGIPSAIDVDDDGDMTLDAADSSPDGDSDYQAEIRSTLRVAFKDSLNANVAGVSREAIDTVLKEGLILGLRFSSNSAQASSVNIDCGTLPYCMAGSGTSTIRSDNLNDLENTPWASYDPDSDGFPNLALSGDRFYVGIKPRSAGSDLTPGDTLYFKANTAKGSVIVPAVLPFYFITGPALKEYSSGSVTRSLVYPIGSEDDGTGRFRPLPLGSTSVTLTMWKPQRPAIHGAEAGDLIDMGKLIYGAHVAVPDDHSVVTCSADDYTVPETGTLSRVPSSNGPATLADSSEDSAVGAANTITYTLDLGACLTRAGYNPSGKVVMLNILAQTNKNDQTSQDVYFRLPE